MAIFHSYVSLPEGNLQIFIVSCHTDQIQIAGPQFFFAIAVMLSARDQKPYRDQLARRAMKLVGRWEADQLQGEFSSHARLGDDRLPLREAQHAALPVSRIP